MATWIAFLLVVEARAFARFAVTSLTIAFKHTLTMSYWKQADRFSQPNFVFRYVFHFETWYEVSFFEHVVRVEAIKNTDLKKGHLRIEKESNNMIWWSNVPDSQVETCRVALQWHSKGRSVDLRLLDRCIRLKATPDRQCWLRWSFFYSVPAFGQLACLVHWSPVFLLWLACSLSFRLLQSTAENWLSRPRPED